MTKMNQHLKVKVGDLVRGYEKGIHRVVNITPGCGCGLCFDLERVLNSNYSKGKGKSHCDGAWIVPVTKEELIKEVTDYTKEALENVNKYL
jgi:hypothetical protein